VEKGDIFSKEQVMKNRKVEKLHNLLVYILGYKPYEFGLVPDENGFVKIKELVKAVCEEKELPHIRTANIDEIIFTIKAPEIEIESDRIRAKKNKAPAISESAAPPALLYSCIRRKAIHHVFEKGISAGENKYVILSSDKSMAMRIGKRKDNKPVLLTVSTKSAHNNKGVFFYCFNEPIYLAEFIPPGSFTGPSLPKEKKEEKKTPPDSEKRKSPGTFTLKSERSEKKLRKKGEYKKSRKEISWKRDKKRLRRDKQSWNQG